MLACGVPWSANDYIIYSHYSGPAAMYQTATSIRRWIPRLSIATMPRRLAMYLPSAYLLVDCRPSKLKGSPSADICLAIL
eukprot:5993294-Pleurochrysis_carterae.AAC.1